MARFKRARRVGGFIRAKARRASRSRAFGGGILGDVMAGAVMGAGLKYGGGFINANVPSLGPLRPTSVALLGIGAAGKVVKKGGKYTDAALIMGSALAVNDILSGMSGASSSGSSYFKEV